MVSGAAGIGLAEVRVRAARAADCDEIAKLCAALWPDSPAQEHARELLPKIEGRALGKMPVALFVAEISALGAGSNAGVSENVRQNAGDLIGFIEVGLRSHADGCDASHPVGFIEGWFVAEHCRGREVGRKLAAAAEQWARGQGCIEMASDTWIDNEGSQRAHQALGYEVVDRCVHYRKRLDLRSNKKHR
jgi:aminoglycoside 6'-N-acetyltransferase I